MEFTKPRRIENAKLIQSVRSRKCSACGAHGPSDPSHIKTQGAGGGDFYWNVVPKCRRCHNLWHAIGPKKFMERFPLFFISVLKPLGWTIDAYGRLRHDDSLSSL